MRHHVSPKEHRMEFHLYCGRRAPGFRGTGVPVADFIAWRHQHVNPGVAETDALLYRWSLRAVMTHPWWDTSRNGPPTVHYNPAHDDIFIAFPTNADGRIFFVSHYPIASLKAWALLPDLYHDYRVVHL